MCVYVQILCVYIYIFCCSFYFCTSSCIQLVRVSFIFFLGHGLFMELLLLKVVCSISHSDEHRLDLPHKLLPGNSASEKSHQPLLLFFLIVQSTTMEGNFMV